MNQLWSWGSWPIWVIFIVAVVGAVGLFILPVAARQWTPNRFHNWEVLIFAVFAAVFGGGLSAAMDAIPAPRDRRWTSVVCFAPAVVFFLIGTLPYLQDQKFDPWPAYYFAAAAAFAGSGVSALLSSFRNPVIGGETE